MLTRTRLLSRPSLLCIALSACLTGPLAVAAGSGAANTDARAQYNLDVERCNTGQTNQDKATCIQEAGAALEEAQRNRLVNDQRLSTDNQIKRCEALPAERRDDCMLQMSGQNTTVHGSVEGGGILRETTITVPAQTQGYAPAGTLAPGLQPAPSTVPAPSLAPVPSSPPTQPYTPATLPPAAGTQ